MSNGNGLKGQWGVSDPAKAGSDQQAQQFQASFQQQIGVTNVHLQYTSANAEAARHDPLAARRDTLYSAFQGALAQIDRTNPAKAAGSIAKVLLDGKAIDSDAAALHQAAEKALNEWKAHLPKHDASVHQIEELEAWEEAKAPALRAVIDAIRKQTNLRQYAQASTSLDQLLPKLKPIYDEYVKQKAAKPICEQMGTEQSARQQALTSAPRPSKPMTAKDMEVGTAWGEAFRKADAKDYVGAVEILKKSQTILDEYEKLVKDPQRVKFLADRPGIEDPYNTVTLNSAEFTSLADLQKAVEQLHNKLDPAADSGDYAGANSMMAELKQKLDELKTKVAEEKAAEPIFNQMDVEQSTRLQSLKSADKPSKPMVAKAEEIDAAWMKAHNKGLGKDFVAAVEMLKKVQADNDALEKMAKDPERVKFLADRPGIDTIYNNAAGDATHFLSLKDLGNAIAELHGKLDPTADGGDYAGANKMIADLKQKCDELTKKAVELQRQKTEYEAAVGMLETQIDEALTCDFSSLKARVDEIAVGRIAMGVAAEKEEHGTALQLLNGLKTKVAAFLPDLKKMKQAQQEFSSARADGATLDAALFDSREFSFLTSERTALEQADNAVNAAATAEDYVKALALLKDVKTKAAALMEKVKKAKKAKEEFSSARADSLTTLEPAMLESRDFKSLQAERAALEQGNGDVNTAASAQDFEKALVLVKDLSTKSAALLAKAKKLKQAEKEFSSARADSVTNVGVAMSESQGLDSLKSERAALDQADAAVNAAALAQDYEKALGLLKDLNTKAAALRAKAKAVKEKR